MQRYYSLVHYPSPRQGHCSRARKAMRGERYSLLAQPRGAAQVPVSGMIFTSWKSNKSVHAIHVVPLLGPFLPTSAMLTCESWPMMYRFCNVSVPCLWHLSLCHVWLTIISPHQGGLLSRGCQSLCQHNNKAAYKARR